MNKTSKGICSQSGAWTGLILNCNQLAFLLLGSLFPDDDS